MNLTKNLFYSLFASLIIMGCSKDDDVAEITGLDFTITANADDQLQIDVLPSATGAATYDVYFDAVGAPTSFLSTTEEAVTSTYPEAAATYTIKVIAKNTNGALDVELTKSHTVSYVAPRSIPSDDFEGAGNITWNSATSGSNDAGFGVNFTTVTNPDSSGINTSVNVGRYEDTNAQYSNMAFDVSSPFDLTTNNVVTVKVYVPTPSTAYESTAQLELKLQDKNSSTPWETQAAVAQSYSYDTWQTLTFDFSGSAAVTNFSRIVVQFNGENNYEGVIAYIDDFVMGPAN